MNSKPNETTHRKSSEPFFPLRAAAIDMGSNAIRFVAAEFSDATTYSVLEAERIPVRLGRGTFSRGRLSGADISASLKALLRFQERMKLMHIEHYRAVATSAVRESSNGEELAKSAKKAGIQLEIIAGSEETRLVYLAVRRKIELTERPKFLMNLGGGSLEAALIDHHNIAWSETHTLGAVRLWEWFKQQAGKPQWQRQLLEKYIQTIRVELPIDAADLDGMVAAGGNIEELAKMLKPGNGRDGVYKLKLPALRKLADELSGLTISQRMRRWGLHPDRADVILPAALVHIHFCQQLGQEEIEIPFTGTKEGILLDVAGRLAGRLSYVQERKQQLLQSALQLGRHYRFDEEHGLKVMELALSLFEQLTALHGLGPEDYSILLAAGLLHDIGAFISRQKHHRHSFYLLAQSELPGLSNTDMQIVANVARYHRKTPPLLQHEPYAQLSESDQIRVYKLASILRLADALDRDHLHAIRCVVARIRRPYLFLELTGSHTYRLEEWALSHKSEMFTHCFGLSVRVRYPSLIRKG